VADGSGTTSSVQVAANGAHGPASGAPGAASSAFERAHAALLKQSDLQFGFHPVVVPPTPEWLKALAHWIGRVIIAIAPAFKFIFWGGLAIGAGLILYFLIWDLVAMRLGWRRPAKARPVQLQAEWKPTAAKARTLLEDADRLAAEGRYGEAVHILLFRSIEDIDRRWPNTVRPALTSRDIAGDAHLSEAARRTFTGIAEVVERSFFGGAEVGAGDFKACREAYAAFALPAAA
jgi:hypothetical protein